MKKRISLYAAITFVLAALLCMVLASCTIPQNDAAAEEEAAGREYSASLNRLLDTLAVSLDSFNEAVSNKDVVGMNAQADNAARAIDELMKLEAPESLGEIHGEYAQGCLELKDALRAYLDLFTEIDSATEASPFDYSTYDSRLSKIKQGYDSGIAHLEKADQLALDQVETEEQS
ncbi:MAG: hypothetical protein FWG24_06075 [Eggerthellaceae bacterium]|jgi:hypothetical protein|nr:hypothetical protein [Eggerthellaceae bacterium]